jgi:hypothetical protein
MRQRLLAGVLAFCAVVATSLVAAPAASATTYCGTYTKTWYLSDGSVPVRLMVIRTHLEVCTNNYDITSTAESTEYSFTGPGILAGWQGSYGDAYRTGFTSSIGAWYHASGYLRDCMSHWTRLFCSLTESYFVNSSVVLTPILVIYPGPGQLRIGRRVFTFSFTPHCGNSACRVRFNTTI